MRVDVTRKAGIHYRCGSSGSGKSWGVKEAIKKASRLIIFDPDDEYEDHVSQTVYTVSALGKLLQRYPRGGLRVRFVANGREKFDAFCKLAFRWSRCVVVAEEIAGVTTPSKAPDGWHTLISRGRKYGIEVFAITQRPAEADKTCIGNATSIRTGRLTRAADRKYIANELDLPILHVNKLENLDFIEVDMSSGKAIKGRLGTRKRKVLR